MSASGSQVAATSSKMKNIIFVSLLLDLLGFTMILPLFPSLLDHYRKNDPKDGLYSYTNQLIVQFQDLVGAPNRFNSVLFGGFLGSMFSFLQFVISPLAGGLSDVYGRKPILLVSLVGIASSYLLWAVSFRFSLFVLARIIGGLSKGNVSLSMAVITDVSTPATRAAGMALVGIAFSVGFVIGPVIGAIFSRWSHTQDGAWFVYPALFALSLALANVLFSAMFFNETLPKEKRAKSLGKSLKEAASFINVAGLFKFSLVTGLSNKQSNELRTLGLVYFVYLFVYSGLEFTLTFLTHHTFQYTAMQQGMMFFWIGLVMAILQGAWVRRIPPNRVKPIAVTGLFLIVPSYICVGFAKTEVLLHIGVLLFAISTSVVVPCMTTLASQYGTATQKGTVMGVFRSLGALARALGPIFASVAFWRFGPGITYNVGALALLWPWYTLMQTQISMKS